MIGQPQTNERFGFIADWTASLLSFQLELTDALKGVQEGGCDI